MILLDAQMPDMDGFETAGHIKQRERTRHVPIIFLTAADHDAHLALRGYAAGAVDYLTKPFDPWVLRAKVSVFVDLWTMHAQLAARATECGVLRAALDDTLGFLDAAVAGTDEPASAIGRARERLAAARAARTY